MPLIYPLVIVALLFIGTFDDVQQLIRNMAIIVCFAMWGQDIQDRIYACCYDKMIDQKTFRWLAWSRYFSFIVFFWLCHIAWVFVYQNHTDAIVTAYIASITVSIWPIASAHVLRHTLTLPEAPKIFGRDDIKFTDHDEIG